MINYLRNLLGQDNIWENELLSRHTTLRIGGPARFLVKVSSADKLKELISYLDNENEKYYLLGNGSNVLFSDEGFNGVVIKLAGEFEDIQVQDNTIRAGAAVLLSKVAAKALENSLSGMEFASGIPGTLGGGLVMNAGAYGGEMKQVVTKATVLERVNDSGGAHYEIKEYSNDELDFSYRHSIAKEKTIYFLSCEIELVKGDAEAIRAQMDELNKQRREKQPLEYPSAGSTFKRPEGYFAGKLISDAGLKGYRVGDAMVSEKHAGFCVNVGNASAADFIKLMDDVSDKVYGAYGVRLEPEVIVVEA